MYELIMDLFFNGLNFNKKNADLTPLETFFTDVYS